MAITFLTVSNLNGKNLTNYVAFLAKFETWLNQELAQIRYQIEGKKFLQKNPQPT
jgi:hypothetical protein